VSIRAAEPADVPLIFSLVVELAEYERAPEQVTGTPELLAEALFGHRPSAEALIAECDGQPVGFALFHGGFSTWECRPGIWLEDLYVPPEHRRSGVGRALLCEVASIAVARGCARLEWAALDWNTPALDFYRQLGAARLEQWVMHRLDGDALERVAAEAGAQAGEDTRP
jgi:GNAT superfamily N-acetyltransferase